MKTSKRVLAVAGVLAAVGCLGCLGTAAARGFDFGNMLDKKYEVKTYEVSEGFDSMAFDLDIEDVNFQISNDGKTRVMCSEDDRFRHDVKVDGNCLKVHTNNTRRWFDNIGIVRNSPKITVVMPQKEFQTIDFVGDTSDLDIDGISTKSMKIEVDTGDIDIKNSSVMGDFRVKTSTGDVNLTEVKSANLYFDTDTGDITLEHALSQGVLDIKTSTGDVDLNDIDSSTGKIETDTGDVSGNILTSKIFYAKTSTGDVNVPTSTQGGIYNITTSTGDIEITVNK